MPAKSKQTVEEYLLDRRVITDSGCWEWTKARTSTGYGEFTRDRKVRLVHRVAFEIWVEQVGDLNVLHKCDNPPCFNPDHLFLGDQSDNAKDMSSKGRLNPTSLLNLNRRGTVISKKRRLTQPQAEQIRKRVAEGESQNSVAVSFGCNSGTVNSIVKGRTYVLESPNTEEG